ncbi:hypothetical protein B0I35DRAFT_357754 [Stachybotrys elegans]|uniref:MHYT domain-containing protein n=1 Tax=Stachybotrys elegans TaxID=80388 RepID=A0A8K0SLZ2_9HYPO|nr:hypothetical protein B0I35DRAFT_357754 [Stachybotrys elegans]
MSSENLLHQYQGHLVPQSFSAGFVALSYVISFIGAASTLELVNRRTGFKGIYNNLLLFGAAVTMGGVSIWSMHFIGNRAIHMENGQRELQIAFSAGITALSFFVPIVVLMGAFLAVGTNSVVSRWRICAGGVLCGASVCGMHYLGNASIHNYTCEYRPSNVVGSAIIAVTASTAALSMFFVFRAMWANAWWKRMISALLLAGAVSGMHWCAAVGTRYRLRGLRPASEEPGNQTTLIVVICLSIGACITIASLAMLKARNMSKSAERAQKISLAAAIFDHDGRILVDPDGLIPSTIITNSFIETNRSEEFGIAHPLYHWMFQASRNWNGIIGLVGSIKKHLSYLRQQKNGAWPTIGVGEQGDDYATICRELFCDAALTLSERMRENLTSMGILWDEILPTGCSGRENPQTGCLAASDKSRGLEDSLESGSYMSAELGRGSLLFLVRRIRSERDIERLETAGYRFADLRQVSSIISSSMQIQTPGVESKLRRMAKYADQEGGVKLGVHLGLFAIKARVNTSGFDILVRRETKHLLPSIPLSIARLETWHMDILARFDRMTISSMLHSLEILTSTKTAPDKERRFAWKLRDSIEALRDYVQDPVMSDALFTAEGVSLPGEGEEYGQGRALLAFRVVVPIHSVVSSPSCEFIPLSFFKTQQLCQEHRLAFIQDIHREFGPVVHEAAKRAGKPASRRGKSRWGRPLRSQDSMASDEEGMADEKTLRVAGASSRELGESTSTVDLCKRYDSSKSGQRVAEAGASPPSYGGIMISQEITVGVEAAGSEAERVSSAVMTGELDKIEHISGVAAADATETGYLGLDGVRIHTGMVPRDGETCPSPTFVDVLFQHCINVRRDKV